MSAPLAPIELAAMTTVLVAMLVILFLNYRPDKVVESLPALKSLDRLQYLSVSIAFPLLTLLLITGAVWANESWGRYWGWDNKEVAKALEKPVGAVKSLQHRGLAALRRLLAHREDVR